MTRAVTRADVQAVLEKQVMDTAAVVDYMGWAGRTSLHHYLGRGITPIAKFGNTNVFWRGDVERLAAHLHGADDGDVEG